MHHTVYVKTPAGRMMSLEVEPSDTTMHVKAQIEEHWGAQDGEQVLMFAGKVLADEQTLFEAGIQRESTIYLVPRPASVRAAPTHPTALTPSS